MHKIAIMATAAVLCSAALADVFALKPGLNSIAAAKGQLAAVEALTTNASATVAVKSVRTVYAYTNAFASPESATYVLGGEYLVTGAADGDVIKIIIK